MKQITTKLASLLLLAALVVSCISTAYAWGETTSEAYEQALELLKDSKFSEAAAKFRKLGSYADAPRYVMYCEAHEAGNAGMYDTAVANFTSLGNFLDSAQLRVYYAGISWEVVENYEKAAEILADISLYHDVSERILGYPALILARDYRRADEAEKANKLEDALKRFKELGTYRDSEKRAADVQEKINARDYATADKAETDGNLEDALKRFKELGTYRDSEKRAADVQEKINARDYATADKAETDGNLEAALSGFVALKDYRDSENRAAAVREKINERDYQKAMTFVAAGDYVAAYDLFVALGDYKDSAARAKSLEEPANYAKGLALIDSGKYKEAYVIFQKLGDYKDSKAKAYALGVSTFGQKLTTVADGVATFTFHDKYGLINLNENITIAPQWKTIGSFHDGLAIAVKSEKYGVVNLKGEVISNYQWMGASDYQNGLCVVARKDRENTSWYDCYEFALMDTQGNIIGNWWDELGKSDRDYSRPSSPVFNDDRIKIGLFDSSTYNSLYGFMDSKGQTIVEPKYSQVYDFAYGRAAVQNTNGKWGFIDVNGQEVIPCKYSEVTSFASNGWADVCWNGEWQIIDQDGKLIYFINEQSATTSDSSSEKTNTDFNLDVLNAAYSLEDGEELAGIHTLEGIIIRIDTPWSPDYHNITVTILCDESTEKTIQCYRLTGAGAESLTLGDTITVSGTIKNYRGTIEFDKGCTLLSIVKGN